MYTIHSVMKWSVLFLLISFSLMMTLAGCSTVPEEADGSSIPWAQPESWENSGFRMPGVGF